MLKKIGVLAFCIGIIVLTLYFLQKQEFSPQKTKVLTNSTPTIPVSSPTPKPYVPKSAVFVPYWQLSSTNDYSDYDDLYYFGITANSGGVNEQDEGYTSLKKFNQTVGSQNTYLTLRMLNTDENITVLRNKKIQEKIIKETLQIAKDNNFKGVVLDFEIGVLPFTNVVDNINSFVANFYLSSKQNNVVFLETVYGDTFYRKRPFDIQFLAKNSDGLVVMAYDLFKANGDAGPNFPLKGKEKFGYDFEEMINHYLTIVPADKLTIVFGMFGYDWITDIKGQTSGTATSISLNEILQKYIYKCDWENCVFKRDPEAAQAKIDYVDSSSASYLIYHTIWFEDQKSVDQKKAFLKQKGIGSVAYWAYGYF
jgi:spore germination protein YaaH